MNKKSMTQTPIPFNAEHSPTTLVGLEHMLRTAPDGISVTVSPQVAKGILETWNTGNRRQNEIDVQRYKRDMLADKWLSGGELGFGTFDSDKIHFGNGQHRMAAQVASGTTQSYHARVFDEEDAFAQYVLTVDGGRNRTLANSLSIFGIADTTGDAAQFEAVVNCMQAFVGVKSTRQSKQERFDFAVQYQPQIRYVLTLPRRDFQAHLKAAIAFACVKHESAIKQVIATIISSETLEKAPLEIQRNLATLNERKNGATKDHSMGMLMRGLYDAIRGRKTTSLRGVAADSATMREAITEFVSAEVAESWALRHVKRGH